MTSNTTTYKSTEQSAAICVPASSNKEISDNFSITSNSNTKATSHMPVVFNQTIAAASAKLDTTRDRSEDPNISKPSFISLVEGNPPPPPIKPIIDVGSPSYTPRKTIFKVTTKDHRGRSKPVVPTPSVLI